MWIEAVKSSIVHTIKSFKFLQLIPFNRFIHICLKTIPIPCTANQQTTMRESLGFFSFFFFILEWLVIIMITIAICDLRFSLIQFHVHCNVIRAISFNRSLLPTVVCVRSFYTCKNGAMVLSLAVCLVSYSVKRLIWVIFLVVKKWH